MTMTKDKLRETFKKKRRTFIKSVSPSALSHLNQIINNKLLHLIHEKQPEYIGAYWPLPGEVNLRPFLEKLVESGYKIGLPQIPLAPQKQLSFHRWLPGIEMTQSTFGVWEPPATAPEVDPTFYIIPFLGADNNRHRLGFGQGYFDATLGALKGKKNLTTVGVGYDYQIIEKIPQEAYDVPLDYIITPQYLIKVRS